MCTAVAQESSEIVKSLLDLGVSSNARRSDGETALTCACADWFANKDIVSLLLCAGANVNALTEVHGTALITAARASRKDIVEQLLEAGAEIDTEAGIYGTALYAAAFRGNLDIVKILVRRNADVTAPDGEFLSALGAAMVRDHQKNANYLRKHGATEPDMDEVERVKQELPKHEFGVVEVEVHYSDRESVSDDWSEFLEVADDVEVESDDSGSEPYRKASGTSDVSC